MPGRYVDLILATAKNKGRQRKLPALFHGDKTGNKKPAGAALGRGLQETG